MLCTNAIHFLSKINIYFYRTFFYAILCDQKLLIRIFFCNIVNIEFNPKKFLFNNTHNADEKIKEQKIKKTPGSFRLWLGQICFMIVQIALVPACCCFKHHLQLLLLRSPIQAQTCSMLLNLGFTQNFYQITTEKESTGGNYSFNL